MRQCKIKDIIKMWGQAASAAKVSNSDAPKGRGLEAASDDRMGEGAQPWQAVRALEPAQWANQPAAAFSREELANRMTMPAI